MTLRDFERHGVYHLCTRGGHDVSIVVIDADVGGATIEGFQVIANGDDLREELVVVDHAVRVNTDAVDFDAHFGAIGGDRFESVSFPEVDRTHSTRYANLAGAYGYEPDVGERDGGPGTIEESIEAAEGTPTTTDDAVVEWVRENGEDDGGYRVVSESDFFDEFGDLGQMAIDREWVGFDEYSGTIAVTKKADAYTGGDNE